MFALCKVLFLNVNGCQIFQIYELSEDLSILVKSLTSRPRINRDTHNLTKSRII